MVFCHYLKKERYIWKSFKTSPKTYSLDKASEVINKWLEESCNESESEVTVSDLSNSYFSDGK